MHGAQSTSSPHAMTVALLIHGGVAVMTSRRRRQVDSAHLFPQNLLYRIFDIVMWNKMEYYNECCRQVNEFNEA